MVDPQTAVTVETVGTMPPHKKKIVPVTLLSGFLGSGKTTLLQHILQNNDNLKCAVIVNDMASINIDGDLIARTNSTMVQKEVELVQFQNGCICCTLRADLLKEVGRLAMSGTFDYIIIESSGISEPMQVAETFAIDLSQLLQAQQQQQPKGEGDNGKDEKKSTSGEEGMAATEGNTTATTASTTLQQLHSLKDCAVLDTCVTVVDVSQLQNYLETGEFCAQRFGQVDNDTNRSVADLLIDQIEFANVIIMNKMDMCPPALLESGMALAQKLNPRAKVIHASYSKVDLREILNTGLFDMGDAQSSAGWLMSLQDLHTPETVEYGIGCFIYHARRPFHPQRIWNLVNTTFCLLQEGQVGEGLKFFISPEENKKRVMAKRASAFSNAMRSKGIFWLATRPHHMGDWNLAGLVLTMGYCDPWFCELPEEMWPGGEGFRAAFKAKFPEETGDKRQEIVFIGQFETQDEQQRIKDKLDLCLVTDEELQLCKEGKFDSFEDPWKKWV